MKKLLINLLIVILMVIVGLVIFQNKTQRQEKIHYHAGFKVFVDNKLQDFSKSKFMTIKPCSEEEEEHEENIQLEKAHLHDQVGNVVHVEAEGAKWKDLFVNINFKFDSKRPLTGYINGNEVKNILNQSIKAYDSVIIFSGKVNNLENKIKNRVPQKRIEQIDKKSESC